MNEASAPPSYLQETRALVSSPAPLAWLTTLDPKRIGVLYLLVSGLALVAAEVLSTVARNDLAASTVLALLFLTPSLPAALGTFFLPLQLGQKSCALPHVSLLGFWLYVLGAASVLFGIVATHGAHVEAAGLTPMFGGALLLSLSAILSSINLLATAGVAIFRGVPASRVTLFAWSICATSLAQILGGVALFSVLPVFGLAHLGASAALLASDFQGRVLAHPWADLSVAGTLMLVPAIGITSDILATFSGKRPAGFALAATSLTALAWLGLVTWAFPLFIGGDDFSEVKLAFTTALLTIPLAVVAFTWLATLRGGRISLAVPMLWALGCLFQVVVAAPAGLLLGLLPTAAYLRDTPFDVGYRQYVFAGLPILGFLAGVHYFWPKITGRLYDGRLAGVAFALVFLGVQVMGLSQMAEGLVPSAAAFAAVSSYGGYALAAGLVATLLVLVVSLFRGAHAPANPWDARGLEWSVASPPPLVNFVRAPADGAEQALASASGRAGALRSPSALDVA
jgi:cytochrome c oxidase subunit 1